MYRSSRSEVFCKKGVLENFFKFRKTPVPELPVPTTSLKKRLWHRCFPLNLAKFSRTFFFDRTPLVAASEYTAKMSQNLYVNQRKTLKLMKEINSF